MGVGTAPGGAKGKNVKSLMKKKKDEKNAKVEKPSVIINGKKPGGAMPRKGEKAGSGATANSPLKDHLSDAGHPAESPTKPDQLKVHWEFFHVFRNRLYSVLSNSNCKIQYFKNNKFDYSIVRTGIS